MCSFTVTNLDVDLNETNFFSQKRGPDLTSIEKINGISFLHNLLHITGEITPQPFIEDDIVCLYNGEIYNFKEFGDYDSDGKCLIPLYKEYGNKFVKMLDGEFAIVLFDFSNGKVIISSDVFRTKPLFYSIDNGNFGFSTFAFGLYKCLLQAIIAKPELIVASCLVLLFISNLAQSFNSSLKYKSPNVPSCFIPT